MPAPARSQQPGACRGDRGAVGSGLQAPGPALEPAPGRGVIDRRDVRQGPAGPRQVPAGVEEHVGNRIPDLAWCPQHVDVTAVGEGLPGSPEHPIHRPREARHDRLEPQGEIPGARRLDQQVHVVALHRVVDEDPEGDVAGMPRGERCAPPVRIARPRPGPAPGADSPAAPARRLRETQRELTRSRRHARDSNTHVCHIRSHENRRT
jgi:hypothetical protein